MFQGPGPLGTALEACGQPAQLIRCFQDDNVRLPAAAERQAGQIVGRGQPGDAAADNSDAGPGMGIVLHVASHSSTSGGRKGRPYRTR